jgi:hypothetical protein
MTSVGAIRPSPHLVRFDAGSSRDRELDIHLVIPEVAIIVVRSLALWMETGHRARTTVEGVVAVPKRLPLIEVVATNGPDHECKRHRLAPD